MFTAEIDNYFTFSVDAISNMATANSLATVFMCIFLEKSLIRLIN